MTEFLICFSAVSLIFTKEEKVIDGLIKTFISNPEKTLFIAKTIMLLFFNIDNIIGDTGPVIPFVSLTLGILVFYSFFLEHYYCGNNKTKEFFNYSLSIIYFFSGIFIFLGYVLKERERKGYFYFFILFCMILVLIFNNLVIKIKIINFKDNSQKLSQFEIFLHVRNLLESIKKKSDDRSFMLNYIEYNNYYILPNNSNLKGEQNTALSEEDENYNFYCKIERSLKNKIILFKNCLLLKMLHFLILKEYIQNYKGAYLILYQLYSNIEKNLLYATYSENFFIYRLKKSIENDSIEFQMNKSDISIRYQINSLIDLITNVSELYFSFWNLLLASSKVKEVKRINQIGFIIHKLIIEIEYKFKEIENIKIKDKKIVLLYGLYLRDVLNDKERAQIYLNIDSNDVNLTESKFKNKNDFISTSQFQFLIISLNRNTLGIIEKISREFSLKLGYSPNELIGQNIKILFPSLLNDEIIKYLENTFKDAYHYKTTNKFLYLKTKSKHIEPFPIKISVQFDEDHNNFLLCKLDVLRLSNKKKINECHILTDKQFIINLYSSSSIHLLNLSTKYIGNSMDISILIREFNEEIVNVISSQTIKNVDIVLIKQAIMKYKFINKENIISWTLTNNLFKLLCDQIVLNERLIGYYFHFVYIPKKSDKGKTIIQNSYSFKNKLRNPKSKRTSILGNNSIQRKSLNFSASPTINDYFNISDNFIPEVEKKINYFPIKENYYFSQNTSEDNIINFFQNYKKNKIEQLEKLEEEEDSEEESFYSNSEQSINQKNKDSNYIDSSDYLSDSDDFRSEEIEIIDKESESEIEKKKKIERKKTEKKDGKKSNKSSTKKVLVNVNKEDENYYKINFNHMHFLIYDFSKNVCEEIKNFEFRSKVEQIILDEKVNILSIKSINKKRRRISLTANLENKKKEEIKEKNIPNEGKIKLNSSSSSIFSLNIYIIIWSVIIVFYFLILLGMGIIYFIICLNIREKIIKSLGIHNSLSDLMQNGNIVYYFSYQLIIIQNSLFTNYYPPREHLKIEARDELLSLYNHVIQVIKEITIYTNSVTQKNKSKIKNFHLNLVSLNKNLKTNITKATVINILEEYAYSIFGMLHLEDEELSFTQKDFNFILSNYGTLLIEHLQEYCDIFIDEFNSVRNYLYVMTVIFLCCFSFVIICSFYLQIKIISQIILEQEKITNIFFKINPEYIINAIKNCENFIELNQKDKSDPEHLVSYPHIQISQKENTEMNSSHQELETHHLINKKIQHGIEKRKTKESNNKIFSKTRLDKNYMYSFSLPIFIYIIILIYIIIFQIKQYKNEFELSNLYFLLLNHRSFYVKYYNYIKTMLIYFGQRKTNYLIKNTFNELKTFSDNLLEKNQELWNIIFNDLFFLKKNELELFNTIVFGNICSYFQNYSNSYQVSCEQIGDGIANYGLYTTSIYCFQLILYLQNNLEKILEEGEKKGYKYDEIYYKSDSINELFPEDKNLWEDYKSLNPFLLINNKKVHDLTILIQQITRNAFTGLRVMLRNKMNQIVLKVKENILFFAIGLFVILTSSTIILIIPKIVRKNIELIEEKNMLKIIPKNELELILIKEGIK